VKFTDIFIKRPILSVVICLVILLLGILGCLRLPIRQFPNIDSSVITVQTTYPGASAAVMENFVTTPLEDAITGVEGIDYINSSSSYSTSSIIVNLRLGYNINTALSDINTQISSVRWELPQNINSPIIESNDPNAQPVYYLPFRAGDISSVSMGNYLNNVIKPMITSLPGVGQINIYGDSQYAMRIWLDSELMAARNITATDIYNALTENNVQATSGQITENLQQFDVYADTDLHTPKEFNNLIVSENNGNVVRIKDLGYAALGSENDTFSAFVDNSPSIILAVIPKSTANPLTVADEVTHLLPGIAKSLPATIKSVIPYNAAQFISDSIHEVFRSLTEAFVIVFLVVFIILGSWRSVCVPLIAIPLSLIGACSLLLALNYSLNTLTLLAFVLAIGLVVDDAIIVTENIHRHILLGKTPLEAAIEGAREIRFAIIAMTVTLAAAYLPIGFTSGLTGILFTEFAFTLACAVIISGVVALVLSPMMCSRIMTMESCTKGFAGKLDRLFEIIHRNYKKLLDIFIRFRWLILAIGVVIYVIGIFLFQSIPGELAPTEDQGFMVGIMSAPSSANLHYTEKYSEKVGEIFRANPNVSHILTFNGMPTGVNSAFIVAILKPWKDRKETAMQLAGQLFLPLYSIPGVTAFPFNFPPLPGTSGFSNIEYVIKSTASYADVNKVNQEFMAAVNQAGFLTNVDTDLKINKPDFNLDINREIAANLGIPMADISQTLSIFLGQPITTRFSMNGENYEVIPELEPQFRNNPNQLNNFYLRAQDKSLVPLSNIATVESIVSPTSYNHFQQLRSATLKAGLAPGVTLGTALDKLNEIAAKVLPANYEHDYSGQLRQYVDASGKMGEVFGFALIFIYLILAAQFESFIDPIIVMLSVPLSLTGALLLLKFTGCTMNIYTEIGLVTLLGLMSKQSILIVEFANQLQEEGIEFKEAILEGSARRFRPIVMTSLAMILGAVPLVLATGSGAVSRFQMGLTIVSGLGIGTFLTLLILPVTYYLFATRKQTVEKNL
jgi:multidrug efflux pump